MKLKEDDRQMEILKIDQMAKEHFENVLMQKVFEKFRVY